MARDRTTETTHGAAGTAQESEALFPLRGYVLLNAIIWAFCLIEILIIQWWLNDIQGVAFFFVLLALGFSVVSIYDAIYDRLAARMRPPAQAAPPSSTDSAS